MCLFAASAVYAQVPVISSGGVLNAASNDKTGMPLAAGSLISIYGSNLVSASGTAGLIPLPFTLSGTSVTINGVAAPMLGTATMGYDQVNVQIPWEVVAFTPPASNGTVRLMVTRNGVSSDGYSMPLTSASPGIFTTGSGVGQAIAYGNTDGILAGPQSAVSHPIKIGDALVILATGLGAVDHTIKSGNIPSPGDLVQTLVKPMVTIGGVSAQVLFSGLTPQFVGVYQINVIVPPGAPVGDNIPLQIQMNGINTRNDVFISVAAAQ